MNKGLTTFRAFAFFAVFLDHILWRGAGYLGVQAFFVLSGFLLTPILLDMKTSLDTRNFFLHFYGRRTLRIFPLYFFYLALVTSLAFLFMYKGYAGISSVDRFLNQLPWSATFTYDFFHATTYFMHTNLVTHFWSLAVEEQFYLIWPVAIFLIPARHFKLFLILISAAGLLSRLSLALISFYHVVPILNPNTDLIIYVLPFSHVDAFAIGGLFALYGKSRSSLAVWVSILLVIAIGLTSSWFATGRIDWLDLGYPPFMRDSYKYIWGYTLVNLMFAYILVNVRDRKFMPAIFENSVLNYLGKISYGMYVYHFGILWLIGWNSISRIVMALAATIAISVISYELMEKRFINLKDRYFSRTSTNVANIQNG